MPIRTLIFASIFIMATAVSNAADNPVSLSQEFIQLLHQRKATADVEKRIAEMDKTFFSSIQNKFEQHIFWVNLYNGFMLKSVSEDTSALRDKKFLSERRIKVAGKKVSLNDIELLFLNRGKKENGKDKFLIRKTFKSWMVEEVNTDILYVLYRGYEESPPVVHLTRENYKAMLTVIKLKFFKEQVQVTRDECIVPAFLKERAVVYFTNEAELHQVIRSHTECQSQGIRFSARRNPDARHFYPRYLH